jgi:hypothetical protein
MSLEIAMKTEELIRALAMDSTLPRKSLKLGRTRFALRSCVAAKRVARRAKRGGGYSLAKPVSTGYFPVFREFNREVGDF